MSQPTNIILIICSTATNAWTKYNRIYRIYIVSDTLHTFGVMAHGTKPLHSVFEVLQISILVDIDAAIRVRTYRAILHIGDGITKMHSMQKI